MTATKQVPIKRFKMDVRYKDYGVGDWTGATPLTSRTRMIGHNDIVIPVRDIVIVYGEGDYVCDSATVEHRSPNPKGWTRGALRSVILKDHRKFDKQGNIWGHVLDDMFIEQVSFNPRTKIVKIFMGS